MTEKRVVRYVLTAIDGSLYDVARSTRIAVRDAFYAVGQEDSLQTQPSFDPKHGGEIVIEYGGGDAATLEHLKRLAEQETTWAEEMVLHAGAGRDKLFTVSVREL